MADPRSACKATGRGRRRLLVNRVAEVGAICAALLAVAVLGDRRRGRSSPAASARSTWTSSPRGRRVFGETGGGIAPALVGSLLLVGDRHRDRAAVRRPDGDLRQRVRAAAARRADQALARRAERLPVDRDRDLRLHAWSSRSSVPILGMGHHQSAIAGGFALAIIMLPLVARSTMEVLALVPNQLREASYALGVSKWRTVLQRRRCRRRSAGSSPARRWRSPAPPARRRRSSSPARSPVSSSTGTRRTRSQSIPLTIFQYSESPDPACTQQAWAAAFVLIMFVLVTSLIARVLLERSRRKLGAAAARRRSPLRHPVVTRPAAHARVRLAALARSTCEPQDKAERH